MKDFIYIIHRRKFWGIIIIILFLGLFVYGYFQTIPVENFKSPPSKEPLPLNIPREYNPNDSLLDLKIEQERNRSREVETVQELLDRVGLSEDIRKQAEQELWRLTQITSKEHELENLLKAKGFNESLVTISQELVSIIIAKKLNSDDARMIGQLASEVTKFNLDQIQIVER